MSNSMLRTLFLGAAGVVVSWGAGASGLMAQTRDIDPERLLRFADTNGDGVVDAEERAAAIERLRQMREEAGRRDRPVTPRPGSPAARPRGPAAGEPGGNRPGANPARPNRPNRAPDGAARPGANDASASARLNALLNRPEALARFDRDGDGELNNQERQAALRALEQMQGGNRNGMMQRFDADGDGELSETERQAMRAFVQERSRDAMYDGAATGSADTAEILDKRSLLERFDADGDGQLSAEERAAARRAVSTGRGDRTRRG
ncbi:MAG: hypothetical protein KDA83_08850 [Planctomycetales bacterium]|nr:hypothetical protein [Planctomycetales bacterium]